MSWCESGSEWAPRGSAEQKWAQLSRDVENGELMLCPVPPAGSHSIPLNGSYGTQENWGNVEGAGGASGHHIDNNFTTPPPQLFEDAVPVTLRYLENQEAEDCCIPSSSHTAADAPANKELPSYTPSSNNFDEAENEDGHVPDQVISPGEHSNPVNANVDVAPVTNANAEALANDAATASTSIAEFNHELGEYDLRINHDIFLPAVYREYWNTWRFRIRDANLIPFIQLAILENRLVLEGEAWPEEWTKNQNVTTVFGEIRLRLRSQWLSIKLAAPEDHLAWMHHCLDPPIVVATVLPQGQLAGIATPFAQVTYGRCAMLDAMFQVTNVRTSPGTVQFQVHVDDLARQRDRDTWSNMLINHCLYVRIIVGNVSTPVIHLTTSQSQ